ncbi:MAG: hypothetical protein FVQ77_05645 [Cytophagales bacterium]|nr:hypothetical protein [Cytophagales bacterium]
MKTIIMKKLLFLTFLSIFLINPVPAQLDNSAFYDEITIASNTKNKLYLGINNLNFAKNNEYFNKIADGYTLFGFQLNPALIYYPSDNVRIDGGIFLWKDFGNDRFSQIAPTFTITIKKNDLRFLFGNLTGSLNHRLIEPIYDFEKIMLDRLEHGAQLILKKNWLYFDAWIDWEKMIYRDSPFQEEVSGGLSTNFILLKKQDSNTNEGNLSRPAVRDRSASPRNKNLTFEIPFQFFAYHKGGQIDTNTTPLLSVLNTAVGFSIDKRLGSKVFYDLRTDNYFVYYKDFSLTKRQAFNEGTGIYLNLALKTKFLTLMVSYWQGERYIAEYGGKLYQSVSSKKQGEYEGVRQLLFLRFMHDVKITDNIFLVFRFEPYYDFVNDKIEFSHGLYVTYGQDIFLKKIK